MCGRNVWRRTLSLGFWTQRGRDTLRGQQTKSAERTRKKMNEAEKEGLARGGRSPLSIFFFYP